MTRPESSRLCARTSDSNGSRTGPNRGCLRERQRHFAAALLDPGMTVPLGLIGPDLQPSKKRFNVYRNNVVAGLVEALKAAFPAVRRIVGDEFFAAMARVYVALEPPRSPIMLDYGNTFPDFIQTFEPAKSVPYLPDVARLERAWAESYHAAEMPPADPVQLSTIDLQSLSEIRLRLHPSVRVVRSAFPIVHLWLMNIDCGVPTAIDPSSAGEHALVVRPVADVEVRRLPVGAATFILRLAADAPVGDATKIALDESADFDLTGTLRDLFVANAIAGWKTREDSVFSPTARYA